MDVQPPVGLGEAGSRLWEAVVAVFDMEEHEAVQLEEACRVRDTIAALRAQLAADGQMIASSQGMRLHPAVGEIRSQQVVLARLLASLDVPAPEEDGLPPSRGVRGVYRVGGAS